MDQGGEASSEDDALELPPIPVERGTSVAKRDCLQPRKPVASSGAAAADRELVADEPAATFGEDRWKASETCPLLLASPGREPPHAPPLRGHATADRVAAFACRVDEPANEPISAGTAKGERGVPKELVRKRSVLALEGAQGGHTNVFSGGITVSPNSRLHLGRSSGSFSVGREVIREIPA